MTEEVENYVFIHVTLTIVVTYYTSTGMCQSKSVIVFVKQYTYKCLTYFKVYVHVFCKLFLIFAADSKTIAEGKKCDGRVPGK